MVNLGIFIFTYHFFGGLKSWVTLEFLILKHRFEPIITEKCIDVSLFLAFRLRVDQLIYKLLVYAHIMISSCTFFCNLDSITLLV